MYDVYVADEYGLGMQQFFDKTNAAARQVIVARLLEVDRQGTYVFSKNERAQMLREFTRLVSTSGVTCTANVCGNRKLQQWVFQNAQDKSNEVSVSEARRMREQFRQAADPRPLTLSQSTPTKSKPTTQASETAYDSRRFTVRWVKIATMADVARKVVHENPWLTAGVLLAMLAGGLLVAAGKRRRVVWAELQIRPLHDA